jgi:hypoxanthine phosphoribosyltransferase
VEVDAFPRRLQRIKGTILLADDVADSGITMREVYRRLRAAVKNKIVTCTGDLKKCSVFVPDYYDRLVDSRDWIVYAYEKKEVKKELKK